mgnify:CR=1 FL=1
MPENNYRKVHFDNVTPTFIVNFWDVSKEKLSSRGHNVGSKALSKKWAKFYFKGRIEHVQSKKHKFFTGVSDFHAFIEKYRV